MCQQQTCFVVQGFGKKTDLTNGRTLNLDASYDVIREAVENAGLKCIRADEIVHSGSIDDVMYYWLYHADLVIADLSTYNVNAAYELGVRYGVRAAATIILAEDQFKNPFDVSHMVIRPYKHLGEDIGRQEAKRFSAELSAAIRQILTAGKTDSPFYTSLNLRPPCPMPPSGAMPSPSVAGAASAGESLVEQNAKRIVEMARSALAANKFEDAKRLLSEVHALRPNDDAIVQQLALATYKSEKPDPLTALKAAQELLRQLSPETTNDPESLGLWGATHKRLWDRTRDRKHLDEALLAYERGFYIKQDYYSGINLAFLLNFRASITTEDHAEAVADFVLARRIRRQVTTICSRRLEAIASNKDLASEKYWVVATLWEAALGVDDAASAARWEQEALAMSVPVWMRDSTMSQIGRLRDLLAPSPIRSLTR